MAVLACSVSLGLDAWPGCCVFARHILLAAPLEVSSTVVHLVMKPFKHLMQCCDASYWRRVVAAGNVL